MEEDLQKIFKTILKTCVPSSDKFCEKLLKDKLLDLYYSKSHIEYYNFY